MRHIDADALIKKVFPLGIGDGMYTINAKAVKLVIDNTPTADVVPKSEVERLRKVLDEYEETSGLKQAKAEIVNEFAEILKDRLFTIPTVYNSHFGRMIDSLVKEFMEGNDEAEKQGNG